VNKPTLTRKVKLLRGRQELINFRYGKTSDGRLIEHVTMEVPNSFLDTESKKSTKPDKKG
jgi:hypothetical protein